MQNELTDFEPVPERSSFLKILCILTFICSSYQVCKGTWHLLNPPDELKIIRQVQIADSIKQKNDSVTRKKTPAIALEIIAGVQKTLTKDGIRKDSFITLLDGLFCLTGAILMWNLKQRGYFFYIAGVVIGIALPFYFFGNNAYVMGSAIGLGFFGILFIIFYGMNLSSMKNPP